jgi:hypothetical protein
MGFDAWEAAREVSRLGIKDASLNAIRTHLKTGNGTES